MLKAYPLTTVKIKILMGKNYSGRELIETLKN